jgi:acyl-CoA hydrolase
MPKDLNSYGTLFGGTLISWMDELAVILAIKITGKECVTTRFDNIELTKSVFVHDVLEVKAKVTSMKRCSMVMDVNVFRVKKGEDDEYVAGGQVKFVALDENKKITTLM